MFFVSYLQKNDRDTSGDSARIVLDLGAYRIDVTLTHWGRNIISYILQTFSSSFFGRKFHYYNLLAHIYASRAVTELKREWKRYCGIVLSTFVADVGLFLVTYWSHFFWGDPWTGTRTYTIRSRQVQKTEIYIYIYICIYIYIYIYIYTVKPVYNDHLMGYFSAFWSSSRWPLAT